MPTFLTIWRRSLCAVTGAIAGAIVGLVMGLYLLQQTPPAIPLPGVFAVGAILGIAAWLAVLIIVGLWQHYGIANIALPSLVTSLITAVLTVLVTSRVQVPVLAVWFGIVIGTLVGALLCWLCRGRLLSTGGADYAMR
jgi:hypothetical protein